jgi:hypothetical protein
MDVLCIGMGLGVWCVREIGGCWCWRGRGRRRRSMMMRECVRAFWGGSQRADRWVQCITLTRAKQPRPFVSKNNTPTGADPVAKGRGAAGACGEAAGAGGAAVHGGGALPQQPVRMCLLESLWYKPHASSPRMVACVAIRSPPHKKKHTPKSLTTPSTPPKIQQNKPGTMASPPSGTCARAWGWSPLTKWGPLR